MPTSYPKVTIHFPKDGKWEVEIENPEGLHQGMIQRSVLLIRKKLRALQGKQTAAIRADIKEKKLKKTESQPVVKRTHSPKVSELEAVSAALEKMNAS